jgi:excisionase family DNA binding protein
MSTENAVVGKLLFDAEEAAERLGLPVSKVRYLAKVGDLGSRKIGKYRRFSDADLREFIDRARVA